MSALNYILKLFSCAQNLAQVQVPPLLKFYKYNSLNYAAKCCVKTELNLCHVRHCIFANFLVKSKLCLLCLIFV